MIGCSLYWVFITLKHLVMTWAHYPSDVKRKAQSNKIRILAISQTQENPGEDMKFGGLGHFSLGEDLDILNPKGRSVASGITWPHERYPCSSFCNFLLTRLLPCMEIPTFTLWKGLSTPLFISYPFDFNESSSILELDLLCED